MKTMTTMLMAGFLMLPFATQADDEDCSVWPDPVEEAIDYANFLGKNADTDRSNLYTKLSAAEAKVTLEKFSDAVDKLMDISDKATALAGASKPKIEDATAINNAVVTAIYCVSHLESVASATETQVNNETWVNERVRRKRQYSDN